MNDYEFIEIKGNIHLIAKKYADKIREDFIKELEKEELV